MIRCPSCRRHHLAEESACPFCGRKAPGLASKLTNTAAACFSAMVLMACYGAPPGGFDDTGDSGPTAEDIDQDGFDDTVDCDDSDAAINPDAAEDCTDTVDNDCDGLIDSDDEECTTE